MHTCLQPAVRSARLLQILFTDRTLCRQLVDLCLQIGNRGLQLCIFLAQLPHHVLGLFHGIVAVLATRLGLGTHYDLSPIVRVTLRLTGTEHTFAAGSWGQIFWLSLLPQLLVWTVYTVAVGLAGGALAWRWSPLQSPRRGGASPSDAVA